MIITSTDTVPGRQVAQILGLVRGNTVRSRWFGRDIAASLKSIVGGEIVSYTEMLTAAREEALQRMIQHAQQLGADAVLNVRFATSPIMQNTAELLAYGTAVKLG